MRHELGNATGENAGVAAKIRFSCWLAVSLVAALACASLWIMDRQIGHRLSDTNLVDLAGEQKMLSQRIALLTQSAATADRTFIHAAAINELRERIATFRANHATLASTAATGSMLDEPTRIALDELVYRPPYDVDFFARKLADDATKFITASADPLRRDEAVPVTKATATATLSGYALISDLLAESANRSSQALHVVYRLLFCATLLILAGTVVFIFKPMIRSVRDHTRELTRARNDMAYLAAHDRLTGLRNRMFLADHFEHMIENARRRRENVGVLHIDLDNFKNINDTYGHMAGDHVLKVIGARIKETVRAADLAARLGGDEFVVLLNAPGTAHDIAAVANRIIDSISRPIEFDNVVFRCGASVGISMFPEDAQKPKDLLIDADLALYQAKDQGRNCVRFFSSELRKAHEVRRSLEADLRQSLLRNEISVNYQPQVSLRTGKVTGIEALARWNRKGQELVPPDLFIPIAEKAGLLESIGRKVISTAIEQAATWQRAGIDFGRLSINLAWSELVRDDFVSFLLAETKANGLANSKLAIEIVEGTILHEENAEVAAKLRQLRAAGVFVELDDFGTGYASLTRVSSSEIDRLKIDDRFIRNIDSDENNRKIVRALVDLAHGLDISVVAEGAETEAEIDTLRVIGCGEVQGYGIAYPMDARQLAKWLMLQCSGEKPSNFVKLVRQA